MNRLLAFLALHLVTAREAPDWKLSQPPRKQLTPNVLSECEGVRFDSMHYTASHHKVGKVIVESMDLFNHERFDQIYSFSKLQGGNPLIAFNASEASSDSGILQITYNVNSQSMNDARKNKQTFTAICDTWFQQSYSIGMGVLKYKCHSRCNDYSHCTCGAVSPEYAELISNAMDKALTTVQEEGVYEDEAKAVTEHRNAWLNRFGLIGKAISHFFGNIAQVINIAGAANNMYSAHENYQFCMEDAASEHLAHDDSAEQPDQSAYDRAVKQCKQAYRKALFDDALKASKSAGQLSKEQAEQFFSDMGKVPSDSSNDESFDDLNEEETAFLEMLNRRGGMSFY